MSTRENLHRGSDFDNFLKEEGIYEEVNARALMRVAVEQIRAEMKRRHVNQTELARRMSTSRSQIHRLLTPERSSPNLETLIRAAEALGKQWKFELVEG
jgi:antitoxin HicB